MKKQYRLCALIFSIIMTFTSVSAVYTADNQAPEERFDNKLGMYTETFAGGRQFVSTVPNNGRTYDAVILDLPQGLETELRCDGRIAKFNDEEPLYETGYYTLHITSPDIKSGENTSTLFVFRIMGTPVANVYNSKYNCPEAFCVPVVEEDSESKGMYIYRFPNYKRFYSSVSENNQEVKYAVFDFPPNVGYELYKNGQSSSLERNKTVTQPGNYSLNVYAKNYGVADNFEMVYKATVNFKIAAPEPSAVQNAANSISSAVSSAVSSVSSGISSQASRVGNAVSNVGNAVSNAGNAVSRGVSSISQPDTSQEESTAEKDNLNETYNEDAKIYKEEFSSGDSFYTNTSNGDITGGRVYIDVPANMTVEMKKDGTDIPFGNRTYINEPGSYSLSITDNFGTRKLNAKYSFRIQQGIDASEMPEEVGSSGRKTDNGTAMSDVSEDADYTFDMDKNRFAYMLGNDVIYMNMPPGMFSNDGLSMELPSGVTASVKDSNGEDYDFSEGKITENGSYTVNLSNMTGSSAQLNFDLYNRAVNMTEEYTVPKGYLITAIEYSDYKGTYTSANGNNADEEAEERENTDNDVSLGSNGEVEEETEETTEISAEDAKRMQDYANGIEIISRLADRAASGGISTLTMPLDGSYSITMEGGDDLPTLQSEILVDRTAPVLEFSGLDEKNVSEGNEFTVSCSDDDVTIILYRGKDDGEVLTENGGSFTVRGVGKYTIVARDAAQNETTYDARIKRHIGAAGVGTIVLFIVLIAAIAGFVAFNSRKFSVR